MKTKKIMIEVIWKPTEQMQNADMLADELTDVVEEALEVKGIEGAAFALSVGR